MSSAVARAIIGWRRDDVDNVVLAARTSLFVGNPAVAYRRNQPHTAERSSPTLAQYCYAQSTRRLAFPVEGYAARLTKSSISKDPSRTTQCDVRTICRATSTIVGAMQTSRAGISGVLSSGAASWRRCVLKRIVIEFVQSAAMWIRRCFHGSGRDIEHFRGDCRLARRRE